jgi:hypothetical protein
MLDVFFSLAAEAGNGSFLSGSLVKQTSPETTCGMTLVWERNAFVVPVSKLNNCADCFLK